LPQVFEYHNDALKTCKAHPQPYVFCIGDIGRVDAEGFVYLSDRESNMIISGGVNIYPAEIEQALMAHPAVEDVAVYGVPNHEWGEVVQAAVQLKPHIPPTEDLHAQLMTFLQERVARFKLPRVMTFVQQLPRTPTGKLLVRELKTVS
jgi:long-chain acyl-CoA synthetase